MDKETRKKLEDEEKKRLREMILGINSPMCDTCSKLTEWFAKQQPHRKTRIVCDSCTKKAEDAGIVFVDIPFNPEKSPLKDV